MHPSVASVVSVFSVASVAIVASVSDIDNDFCLQVILSLSKIDEICHPHVFLQYPTDIF